MLESILREWRAVTESGPPCNPEPIGGGFCRFHMTAANRSPETAATLAGLFMRSAAEHAGTREGLEARLRILEALPVAGMHAWIADYRERGCPPVRHSEAYRTAYRPHYRVVLESPASRLPR